MQSPQRRVLPYASIDASAPDLARTNALSSCSRARLVAQFPQAPIGDLRGTWHYRGPGMLMQVALLASLTLIHQPGHTNANQRLEAAKFLPILLPSPVLPRVPPLLERVCNARHGRLYSVRAAPHICRSGRCQQRRNRPQVATRRDDHTRRDRGQAQPMSIGPGQLKWRKGRVSSIRSSTCFSGPRHYSWTWPTSPCHLSRRQATLHPACTLTTRQSSVPCGMPTRYIVLYYCLTERKPSKLWRTGEARAPHHLQINHSDRVRPRPPGITSLG